MEASYDIRIGATTYALESDDNYLPKHEAGFEPAMVSLFLSLVPSWSNVLDIGANIGCTTLLFGQLAARVVSFEPSATTFGFLSRNVAISGMANIQLENYALGDVAGEAELTRAANNRAGGFVSTGIETSPGHIKEVIRVERLDDVVGGFGLRSIDFIKIDVEGFEKNVLEGARDTISRDLPIVVVELNHWCLNAFRRLTVPDYFDYLCALFPIALAVDDRRYLDLHHPAQRYGVMFQHINHFRFPNIVCAFDRAQIEPFLAKYPNA